MLSIVLMGCTKDDPPEPDPTGKLKLSFYHFVDGAPLTTDQLIYTNAAGNEYLITEVQWFLSDVMLHRTGKPDILIDDWERIHYVDNDLPETMSWEIYDPLAPGSYDSISFHFGIASQENITLMYVNPPERDMFWPVWLGGGYHYMKVNGKWKRPDDFVASFDYHLGIGQIYASNVIVVDSITAFVDNSVRVGLPASSFNISDGKITQVDVVMNIERWFRDPHVIDLNVIGGYTMQNQDVMHKIKENAENVFTIGLPE
ncbi:MAG: hypothetical protein IH599_07995 [Bacteroidales bacterium]|nr:hypothetical protein [Bacteroidales bacterium]